MSISKGSAVFTVITTSEPVCLLFFYFSNHTTREISNVMSTRKLAKELGILRQRSQSSNGSKKSLVSNQTFSYLIVIDFESTCWREKNNYSQEIIEFPAVLLNTSTGEVESEFHTYVQPQEHPVLSEFCTELTGITQVQVEAGIPLQICLSRFSRWLQNLQLNMGVVFTNRQQMTSAPSPSQKLCTFLTWSDWDLGVCLQYECKRKQLHKPDVLNSWIDLRSTYRLFYDRKPKGLNGALQDLGIQFAGREHSGLDDARNTAKLAARMMRDGCVMKITRSLVRNPLMVKPKFGNTNAENKKEKSDTVKEEKTLATDKPSSSKMPPESCRTKSSSVSVTKENSNLVQGSVQKCQSLISPKTLLNGTNTPPWGLNNRSVATTKAVTNVSSLTKKNFPSPHNIKTSSSLVLCPTTVGSFSSQPQTNQQPKTEETEEGVELLVETEDRCGSYDEVVLGGDDVSETEKDFDAVYVSDLDGGCYVWEEPDNTHSSGGQDTLRDNMRETVCVKNNFKTQKMTRRTHFTNNIRTHVNGLNHVKENGQRSTISEPNTYFAVPKPVNQNSKTNQHKNVQEKSNVPDENAKTSTPFLFRHKPFMPGKTSTPLSSFIRPKPVITQHANDKRIPTTSFTIFTDPAKPASPSSSGSFCTSKNVLSSLSTNTLSSRTNISSIAGSVKSGQRVTSPLCACGRRAKRQVVSNGGPNHGRVFYCCPVRRSGSGCRVQKGCEFFKWESAVMKSSSVASPAVRSSVSLCQINSTLSHRPPNKSTIRKSY